MSTLTKEEAEAVIYFAVGVATEGGDAAYRLSFAGNITHDAQGRAHLTPADNSGYTIGTLQTDLGQDGGATARQLMEAFQSWATKERPSWTLSATDQARAISDLSRNGSQIRDADDGRDIDPTLKSHLNTFLGTTEGISFVHVHDVAQTNKLVSNVVAPLNASAAFRVTSSDDQARMLAVTAKAFNQNETIGRDIVRHIQEGSYRDLGDITRSLDHRDQYIKDGKDLALEGAELFNALQHSTPTDPLRAPWTDALADPLVNPTQLGAAANPANMSHTYPVVKDLFVDTAHGTALVNALNHESSYGAAARGRGFFGQGDDLVMWDRYGQGHAYVSGEWRSFDRNELTLKANPDSTLDIGLQQDGLDRALMHMEHPSAAALRYARLVGEDHIHQAGTLSVHDTGPQVVTLQSELARWKRVSSNGSDVTIDGEFGPGTRRALEAFQRTHDLQANGIGDATTLEALKHAPLQQSALTAMNLDNPLHPAFPLFQQAVTGVGQIDQAQGRATDFRSYNLSGALALAARKEGLERIDQVILSEDASRAIAVQGDIRSPLRRFADVDVVSGVSTPLAQSSTDWAQFQQNVQAPTPLMQSADVQVVQPSMQR